MRKPVNFPTAKAFIRIYHASIHHSDAWATALLLGALETVYQGSSRCADVLEKGAPHVYLTHNCLYISHRTEVPSMLVGMCK